MEELTKILNAGQWSSLKQFLIDIRYEKILRHTLIDDMVRMKRFRITLFVNRCRKSIINLPVQVCGHLSFAPGSSIVRSLSKHRLFLRFSRYENYLLVRLFFCRRKCSKKEENFFFYCRFYNFWPMKKMKLKLIITF